MTTLAMAVQDAASAAVAEGFGVPFEFEVGDKVEVVSSNRKEFEGQVGEVAQRDLSMRLYDLIVRYVVKMGEDTYIWAHDVREPQHEAPAFKVGDEVKIVARDYYHGHTGLIADDEAGLYDFQVRLEDGLLGFRRDELELVAPAAEPASPAPLAPGDRVQVRDVASAPESLHLAIGTVKENRGAAPLLGIVVALDFMGEHAFAHDELELLADVKARQAQAAEPEPEVPAYVKDVEALDALPLGSVVCVLHNGLEDSRQVPYNLRFKTPTGWHNGEGRAAPLTEEMVTTIGALVEYMPPS